MRRGREPEATASGPAVLACQASPRVASGRDGAQRQSRTSRPARQTTLASHDEDCYLRRAPSALRVGDVYCHGSFLRLTVRDAIGGQWRQNLRPQAWIFAGRELWKGWTVMDRLGEIKVPTLVMAGRDDVFSPPRAPGPAGCGHPPRTPTDHRARRSLPLLRAAGRGDGGGHHGHGQGDSRDHGPYRAEGSREGISEVPHLAGWCERRAAARGVIDRAVLASLTDGSIALSPLRPARQTKAPTYGRIGSGRTRRMSPVAAPGR